MKENLNKTIVEERN